jgi:hypothetical protein
MPAFPRSHPRRHGWMLKPLRRRERAKFKRGHGLPTQVAVGAGEGLKHESAIQCDGLMSLEKSRLTDFVGELTGEKLRDLETALLVALGIPTEARPPA